MEATMEQQATGLMWLFCDGGVNGGRNPGDSVYWSVGKGVGEGRQDTEVVIKNASHRHTTNNEAEYLALNDALLYAFQNREGLARVVIHSDSQLIVNQFGGAWACGKEELVKLRDLCRRNAAWLRDAGVEVDVVWVRRAVSVRRLGH